MPQMLTHTSHGSGDGPDQFGTTEISVHYGRTLSRSPGETLQANEQSSVHQRVSRKESCSKHTATTIYCLLGKARCLVSSYGYPIEHSSIDKKPTKEIKKKPPKKINTEGNETDQIIYPYHHSLKIEQKKNRRE